MEVEVGEHVYKIGKLSAFDKLYVSKRVAPALWAMAKVSIEPLPAGAIPTAPSATPTGDVASQSGEAINAADALAAPKPALDPDVTAGVLLAFGPVVDAVGKMSDQDLKFVVDTCLLVCHRKVNGQWAPVMTKGRGFMFEGDMDMPDMLQLVYAVIQENLGNFSPALQASR